MNNKQVAIVIPTFNRANFVEKAIDSALDQTYPCEVIVCDHGSTDNTPQVMRKYADRIKYIRREIDLGIHFCWLEGVLSTQAEYVHIQYDDDWIGQSFIEKTVNLMAEDVGMVVTNAVTFDQSSNSYTDCFHLKDKFRTGIYSNRILEKISLSGQLFSPASCLFRKTDIIDALYQGKLPLAVHEHYFGVGPDHFMTLITLLRYEKFGIVSEDLAFFRVHDNSITVNAGKDDMDQKKLDLAYENARDYYRLLKWFKFTRPLKYLHGYYIKRLIKQLVKWSLKKAGLLGYFRKLKANRGHR